MVVALALLPVDPPHSLLKGCRASSQSVAGATGIALSCVPEASGLSPPSHHPSLILGQ